MEKFASQDSHSYSLNFDLNIWFRARKVTGTFEKRVPGLQQFFFGPLALRFGRKMEGLGPPGPLPRICNFTTEETLAEVLLIDFISFQKYSSQPQKNCYECNRYEINYRLSFKNFLLFCQAFPVHRAGCDLRDTVILLSCQYLATCPDVLQRTGRKSGENQQKKRGKLNLVNKLAPSLKQIWIGLEWGSRVKAFLWYDHSVPTFTKWAPNEPSGKAREPYGHMWTGHEGSSGKASGDWNDLTCWHTGLPCGLVCKRLP